MIIESLISNWEQADVVLMHAVKQNMRSEKGVGACAEAQRSFGPVRHSGEATMHSQHKLSGC